MTLANRITILRIILVPVFVVAYLQSKKYPDWHNWMLGIFAFAILTDLLDGFVARLMKQKTELGTFLDPLADKLLMTATFVTLAFSGELDLWVFVVIFSRDLLIVLGWTIVYLLTNSAKIEPRPLGKACVFLQMIFAICLLFPIAEIVTSWMMRLMVSVTILSAIDYVFIGSRRLEPIPR